NFEKIKLRAVAPPQFLLFNLMKYLIAFGLFMTAAAFTPVKPKKIIFFGDSITQAGVNPGGYITLMQQDLKSKGLSEKYELSGAGIGGNKIYDLYLRMEKDV